MINPVHLKERVIEPTLSIMEEYNKKINSPAAAQLLQYTSIVESTVGGITYLVQDGGPALGIFQVEPNTHDDIVYNFIHKRPILSSLITEDICPHLEAEYLIGNDFYSACIARLVYWRIPHPLPEYGDLEGMARYWKKYYNTPLGKGTEQHFISQVKKYT